MLNKVMVAIFLIFSSVAMAAGEQELLSKLVFSQMNQAAT